MDENKPTKPVKDSEEDLTKIDIKINEFGQINTNISIDNVNEFLNRKVDDKKIPSDDQKEE